MSHQNSKTLPLTEGLNAKTVTSCDTKYPSQVQPYSSDNLFKSTGFDIRCHWLQGTIKCSVQVWQEFCVAIAFLPGDKIEFFEKPTVVGILWEKSGRSPGGIKVGFNQDGDNIHGFYLIPGSYLDGVSSFEGFSFIWMLNNFKAKLTRIDLVFIDYQKMLLPQTVVTWCDAGLLRGARKYSFIPGEVHYEKQNLISHGSTLYIGSRQSEKYLRIYEAAYLHNSDSIRWELELKGDSAQLFAERFQSMYSRTLTLEEMYDLSFLVNDFVRATIFGNLKFVTLDSKSERLSRADLLSEWVEFLTYAADNNVIKTNPTRPMQTLEKTLKWMKIQVAPTIARLKRLFGSNFQDYIHNLIIYGLTRHDNFDNLMVKYICYLPPDDYEYSLSS